MKALSVKQPWAWAMIHGGKDIENRDWPTKLRGPLAIHASKAPTKLYYVDSAYWIERETGVIVPAYADLVCGAILGTVTLVDCVESSTSPWFMGEYGFVLRDPKPLIQPIVSRGSLGFWEFDIPEVTQ